MWPCGPRCEKQELLFSGASSRKTALTCRAVATMQTAEFGITVGETYDFEYQASTPQDLALEVYLPGPKLRVTQGLVFAASRPSN